MSLQSVCNPPGPPYPLDLPNLAALASEDQSDKGGGERIRSLRSQGLRRSGRRHTAGARPQRMRPTCSRHVSVCMPVHVPVQAAVRVPVQMPVRVPVQMPVRVPVQAPVQVPVQVPVQEGVRLPPCFEFVRKDAKRIRVQTQNKGGRGGYKTPPSNTPPPHRTLIPRCSLICSIILFLSCFKKSSTSSIVFKVCRPPVSSLSET